MVVDEVADIAKRLKQIQADPLSAPDNNVEIQTAEAVKESFCRALEQNTCDYPDCPCAYDYLDYNG